MKKNPRAPRCRDCSRRQFLKVTAGLAAITIMPRTLPAQDDRKSAPCESLVRKLFESLTDRQRQIAALPWDDKRRTVVSNNWTVVDPNIGELYTREQQQLIRDILKTLMSEEGYEKLLRQMRDDWGGLENYTCAFFGEPDSKLQWVLAGRHVTLRWDDSRDGPAFGGPIFYGHAPEFNEKPDHPGNVWWDQGRAANKIYAALDEKQRARALRRPSPPDSDVCVRFSKQFPGLPVTELSRDQKPLVEELLRRLLAPYRKTDQDEALEIIKANGGVDAFHLSFYSDDDIGQDGVWDRWQLQGPGFVWYMRGSPHIHTWVHIDRV